MKKILFLFLVSILSFSLIGCKKNAVPNDVNIIMPSSFGLALEVGETVKVSATVNPVGADQAVVWSSSNPAIATVDQEGLITAIAVGSFTLRATSIKEDVYGENVLDVILESPTALEVVGPANVVLGEIIQYSVTPTPSDAFDLVVWTSSDEDLADFDGIGQFSSYAAGEVTVTATSQRDESVTASLVVTISLPEPETVEVVGPLEVSILDDVIFTANVYPVAAKQNVVWSISNPDIATINQEGKLTIISIGQVIITATSAIDSAVIGNLSLTITLPAPASVIVTGDSSVEANQTLQLSANVLPVEAVQTILWSSNNTEIATVDENGLVTAIKAGTVTIIATSIKSSIYIQKIITVTAPSPESLVVSGPGAAIRGLYYECKAIVTPSAAIQNVVWSSSDEAIATIDENGVLTLVNEGTVTITATSTILASVTGTLEIIVAVVNAVEVEIDDPALILLFTVVPLNYTVYPEGAKDDFVWSSSDESVATISQEGVVTPLTQGDVTFTLTSDSDSVVKFDCQTQVFIPEFFVDQSLQDYTLGQEVVFKGVTYSYGTTAFNSLSSALSTAGEGASIYLCDGIYSELISISKNETLIFTSNSGINPNKNMANRSAGAVFTNRITIEGGVQFILLDGLDFTGAGQVASGDTNVTGLAMFYCNFYGSTIPIGDDGVVYFKEVGNTGSAEVSTQQHHDFFFSYNRFVVPTTARLINIGRVENLTVKGNYFESNNIQYSDGVRINNLSGNFVYFVDNTFVKISQYAIFVYKENAASNIYIINNIFTDAINSGSIDIRNTVTPNCVIEITNNVFDGISGTAIRIDHEAADTVSIKANYNIFKGIGSKYLNNNKAGALIDFTNNFYADALGKVIDIDVAKIVGASTYTPYCSDINGVVKYIPTPFS